MKSKNTMKSKNKKQLENQCNDKNYIVHSESKVDGVNICPHCGARGKTVYDKEHNVFRIGCTHCGIFSWCSMKDLTNLDEVKTAKKDWNQYTLQTTYSKVGINKANLTEGSYIAVDPETNTIINYSYSYKHLMKWIDEKVKTQCRYWVHIYQFQNSKFVLREDLYDFPVSDLFDLSFDTKSLKVQRIQLCGKH